MSPYVSRVIQLDALILDTEFYSLLKNQIFNVFNLFKVGHLTHKYGPELQFLIKLVIWKFTVLRRSSSAGQALLGIRYSCDKGKLKLLFLMESFIPYIYQRCLPYLQTKRFFAKIEKPLKLMEDGLKVSEILNFLIFLMQNRYPSLINRILKLRMVPVQGSVHPSVGYSYQLREMLWHQFAEFLMVVLPIINFHRVKRYLTIWGLSSSSKKIKSSADRNENVVLKCCICKQDAVIPQKKDDCNFCFYCIKANSLADPHFQSNSCQHSK